MAVQLELMNGDKTMTTEVEGIALKRAMQLLNSIGAKYCIKTKDGETLGELEVKPQITRKVKNRGFGRAYLEPILGNLEPGNSVVVKLPPEKPDMTVAELHACVAGYCSGKWGTGGTYMSHRMTDGVEVLRMAAG